MGLLTSKPLSKSCLRKSKAKGITVADDTNEAALRKLIRKMRVYNPIESKFGGLHNPIINNIIEDIFHRSSTHSYFIQAVDAIAYCLYRKEYPKGSLKKFGFQYLFDTLDGLLLKEAASNDFQGMVLIVNHNAVIDDVNLAGYEAIKGHAKNSDGSSILAATPTGARPCAGKLST